jgi:dTDP-4-amino-4,6-dideoxygalactose transaminase
LADRVTIPARVADSASAWAIYAILVSDAARRDALQLRLREAGVPTAIYYPRPLHRQPAYAPHHRGSPLPVSDDLAGRILALPIHPDLLPEQAARVARAVTEAT